MLLSPSFFTYLDFIGIKSRTFLPIIVDDDEEVWVIISQFAVERDLFSLREVQVRTARAEKSQVLPELALSNYKLAHFLKSRHLQTLLILTKILKRKMTQILKF